MPYPIKLSLKSEIAPVLAVVAAGILSFYFYAHLPATVANHWNWAGQPDGYTSKASAAFGMPVVLLGMYVLFLALPLLDPKRERYQEFGKIYHMFKGLFVSVFFAIYVIARLNNLGYNISMQIAVPLIVGLLLVVIGNYMGKIKNNWFMGIRNPWTLSSENIWNRTHRLGGWSFILFGIIIMISPLLPQSLGLPLFLAGTALVVFGTNTYSYLLYRKEQRAVSR